MRQNRLFAILLLILAIGVVNAQTTEFTYQGKLNEGGLPITTPRDLSFSLWDDELLGLHLGTRIVPNVSVTNGIFTVHLDFGQPVFGVEARWMEIAVSLPGTGEYTTLAPSRWQRGRYRLDCRWTDTHCRRTR